jgi:electron transfer flavoprotein beta subunit
MVKYQSMDILVCIKQVPGTTQVAIDEDTGTLKRDGLPSKMNPFDLYAIETALRLKAKFGAHVTVMTMGPPQAEAVIREAFAMGVDRGIILSDRAFGGADVLMTSYTLSQGIRKTGPYDLVICGKQTTDGDTAQVGAAIAQWLEVPHVTNVKAISAVEGGLMSLTVDLPDSEVDERLPFPCLITVEKGIYEPRLPSYRLKMASADRPILRLGLSDLPDTNSEHYGLKGSPTQVKRIFPPQTHVQRLQLEGDDCAKASRLVEILVERKFIS